MKETTRYKLPYPEDTDAPNGPEQIKKLAEAIENLFRSGKVSSAGAVVSGTGFTAEKTETGQYRITFTKPLQSPAAVMLQCTGIETGNQAYVIVETEEEGGLKAITVKTTNLAGEIKDKAFAFFVSAT